MTKEKLEKEAEEWLDDERKYIIEDNEGNLINITKKVKEAYLAGAESREKCIEDLEARIKKIKSDVIKSFGDEYNLLVAKLLIEWR